MIGTWRQQQAQQTVQDLLGNHFSESDANRVRLAVDDAVEIATTVKITQDALDVFEMHVDVHDGAVAFLKELGFEVVQ